MNPVALCLKVKVQPGKRDQVRAMWEKHLKPRVASTFTDNDPQIGRSAITKRIMPLAASSPRLSRPDATFADGHKNILHQLIPLRDSQSTAASLDTTTPMMPTAFPKTQP